VIHVKRLEILPFIIKCRLEKAIWKAEYSEKNGSIRKTIGRIAKSQILYCYM
jgi:hypothetical protein